MIRRGDRVRFAHRYVGEVVKAHSESRWVVVLWLDGHTSGIEAQYLEALTAPPEHHYGRWTVTRRAALRLVDGRWVWQAVAPYPFDRRPVILTRETQADLFSAIRADELSRMPWAGARPRFVHETA